MRYKVKFRKKQSICIFMHFSVCLISQLHNKSDDYLKTYQLIINKDYLRYQNKVDKQYD